jgi:hypothetical protein
MLPSTLSISVPHQEQGKGTGLSGRRVVQCIVLSCLHSGQRSLNSTVTILRGLRTLSSVILNISQQPSTQCKPSEADSQTYC